MAKTKVHVKYRIDDDQWAKHPYGFEIFNEDGELVFSGNSFNSREECDRAIERKGYEIVSTEDFFY